MMQLSWAWSDFTMVILQLLARLSVIDVIVLSSSVVLSVAYLVRFDSLQYGKHKAVIIIFHGALFVTCASSAINAWLGEAGLIESSSVVVAFAWLVVSRKTWAKGQVPAQFEIEPARWRHISGGRK